MDNSSIEASGKLNTWSIRVLSSHRLLSPHSLVRRCPFSIRTRPIRPKHGLTLRGRTDIIRDAGRREELWAELVVVVHRERGRNRRSRV
jgi:hypothetical protein